MAEKKFSGKKTIPSQSKGTSAQAKKANDSILPSKRFLVPSFIFLFCFLLYGNTLNHDYALDDDIYTKKNVFVQQGFSAFKDIFNKGSLYGFNKANDSNYRPLTLLDFMTEVSVFGMDPHVSHFFNVLFFSLTCLLLYKLMQLLFKEYHASIPIFITLLFACHPVHTEVVANIKSRDEILVLLFGVSSFYLMMRYYEKPEKIFYIGSFIAFTCAIFSKEDGLTFLLIIPLMLYFFTSMEIKKIIRLTLPFLGMIVLYMIIRSWILSSVTFNDKIVVMNNALMAAKSTSSMLATNFEMLGKYIYLLFVPYPLSWDYSFNQIPIVTWSSWSAIFSLLLYTAMAAYILWKIRKKDVYAFALLFYLITLFLESNLVVKIGSTFAERFLYMPSLALCIALPLLLAKALKINPHQKIWKQTSTFNTILIGILIVYAFILIPRNRVWENNFTLFQSGVLTSPNSARTHGALASAYRDQAEAAINPQNKQQLFQQAVNEYAKTLAIYNQDPDAYYNLGVTFYECGLQDSAMKMYQKTIALNPKYTNALNNLGVIYFNKKEYDNAIHYLTIALSMDTNYLDPIVNIGASYQNENNYTKAIYYYNKGLQKSPNNQSILKNLSNMYNGIGIQYFQKKDYDNAMENFNLAMKYDPSAANPYGNMGVIYQSKGDNAKAVEYYQKALAIDPNNTVFKNNLAKMIATQTTQK
ncbi:MAG: tetratricopeptide repeat protein [Bacteroidia bacterium]